MGNEELVQFQNLQKNEMRLAEEIIDLEENKIVIIKEHRRINELIRLNELKIRNRSKEIEAIQRNIDENELKLFKEIAIFQEINLYQLPLILNRQLKDKVDSKNNQSIEVLDKKEFENSFDIFIQTLESSLSKSEVLKSFYQVFQMNKGILLTYTKSDLINLLIDIKNSIDKKERFLLELEQTKEKLLEKNNFKKLEQEGVALNLERNNIELKINLLNDQLENKHTEHKEVHKKLRLEFIAKRDKYAKIKAIEELYNISEVSKKVYNTKLAGSLNQFNQLFSEKIKPFLETYQHIEKIYINDKFKVILEDRESRFLDIALLSAGQKQILSFILISTVLEFKQFVDFIFIDTPFGRLSNKNRDFIFNNYYLKFSYLTLLITSSEYDYLKDKNSTFKKYTIEKNGLGSTIGVAKND
jgi:DNA sulfur modification protein DndD